MTLRELFMLSERWGRLAFEHPDDSRLLFGGIARRVRKAVSYRHRARFFRLCCRRFWRFADGGQ
jgi:hypothetical protein